MARAIKTESSKPSLEVVDLCCIRDDLVLFSELNFTLHSQQILLIHGRNGCGKTSLLRLLAGLGLPDEGDVQWRGQSIEKLKSDYYQQLSYVGHHDGIKGDLTAAENLRVAVALGQPSGLSVDSALEQVNLYGYEDILCHALSAGQRRRVALSRLLVTSSQLWILDEPFTSLDVDGIALFEQLMVTHVERGGLIVLTSHHPIDLPDIELIRLDLS